MILRVYVNLSWGELGVSLYFYIDKRAMRVAELSRSALLILLLCRKILIVARDTPNRQRIDRAITPAYPPCRSIAGLAPLYVPSFLGALYCVTNTEWNIDFHAFNTLLPLSTAAATLQSFYEDIAAAAATTTISTAERYMFRVGQITWEVRSALGAIPLMEVVGLANWMREHTKRGFTGTYQVNFVHRGTGKLVTMSLWIGILRWG